MRVSEIFYSISGEGRTIGIPTLFIRLYGCNLSCKWCDTQYAYTKNIYKEYSIDDIIDIVKKYNPRHIIITGGEPLLQPKNLIQLVRRLLEFDISIEIETNGSLYINSIRNYVDNEKLFFTVDYKLPSSGMELWMLKNELEHRDQLKFVIGDDVDYERAKKVIKEYPLPDNFKDIVFSPVGGIKIDWLVKKVLEDRLQVRVLPQLHKIVGVR